MSGVNAGERPAEGDPFDAALASAVRSAGARFGAVYVLDPAESTLGLIALCGAPVEAFAPWWRAAFAVRGPSQDAVREQRFVWVGSLEELARVYPRVAAAVPYPSAMAAVPLTGVRHCRGVLFLAWTPGRSPLSRSERSFITLSAQRIARVLDAAAVPPVIPDRPRFVHPHGAKSQAPSGLAAADLVERLPLGTLALDLEGRITFVNTAAATLLDRPAEQLLGTQPWQSLPWLDNTTYIDAYRMAMNSHESLTLTVLRPPEQWLDLRLHADDSGLSILITPDCVSQPMAMQPASAGAPSESRIHLLMVLAAALTETIGVQDVVELVADQIQSAFGAHGMIMSTVDAGRIRIIGHRGYTPDVIEQLDGVSTDADLTPAGQALATGTASFFADRSELARLYPKAKVPQNSGKQSWAFLPLISSGRPLGCLLLAYNRPHAFTVAERSILTPLAGLVAQALDRAHLYETKHSLAHTLQQALLPRALPTVAGLTVAARYLPASHGMDIGGDFYDLIRLTDTTVAAVIGDVQGHDMTAAALMGQVRMAVHSHATAGATPDQVLTRTDRDLADLDAGRFVTCLYAHLDLARQQMTIASAGHAPPLLRHPDNQTHALDICPGPPLGLGIGNPTYPLTTLPFPTESLLALYTDGLVETPGLDITETTADLARHLGRLGSHPLHELADALVHHAGRTKHHTDDTALLLLQPNRATIV
ncbi:MULTISPECIES: SpoIIE family protein phosphatase [unclassified Streptomyces]|uniref:SpoIIE family protein phosphatase n=1 Tax=unclassified Streptomyces TaxID=2593676 RepID=UPI002255A2FE|nr:MULTISPECIES: SpoIIE family protein phosphatase [unclassified Streptomyces]MCX5328584.1 SpoIIE family protein phosphatase [Streptomyces sp. NBC_00140]MCX5357994.1 SpoIIE family protein phosphatase [Streptomyces sp. NBC_00124]